MSQDYKVLSKLRLKRLSLIEILILAGLFAFGVSLFSMQVFSSLSSGWTLALSGTSILISLLFLFYRKFSDLSHHFTFSGFFLLDEEENDFVEVENYRVSWDLSFHKRAAFQENSALIKQWDDEPLKNFLTIDEEKKRAEYDKNSNSYKLLCELFEYLVLKKLSIHLTDFYDNEELDNSNLKKLNRKDIPNFLLENRFLNLFSRPMVDRPAFSEKNTDDSILMSFADGIIYSKFDLTLPSDSTIRKISNSEFKIESKYLDLTFNFNYTGSTKTLSKTLLTHYIGIDNPREIKAHKFIYNIEVDFKKKILLSKYGRNYFEWIESFIIDFEKYIDAEKFLDRLNWNTIEALIRTMENRIEVDSHDAT